MLWDLFLKKVLVKKRFVGPVNSARNPLKNNYSHKIASKKKGVKCRQKGLMRCCYSMGPTIWKRSTQTRRKIICIKTHLEYSFGFKLIWHLHFMFCVFLFFFFFVQLAIVDKPTVNSAPMHCSWVLQITLFSNFFIKNEFHSTI